MLIATGAVAWLMAERSIRRFAERVDGPSGVIAAPRRMARLARGTADTIVALDRRRGGQEAIGRGAVRWFKEHDPTMAPGARGGTGVRGASPARRIPTARQGPRERSERHRNGAALTAA